MSADSEPNVKLAPVPIEVPRDPGEYRVTFHFRQRLHERVPKPLHGRVIRECIERGHCRGACPPEGIDEVEEGRMLMAFAFDYVIEDIEWTVVVGVRKQAFLGEEKHLALTVYGNEVSEE